MECEAEDGVVLRRGWVREEAVEEVVMCVVGRWWRWNWWWCEGWGGQWKCLRLGV